MLTASISRRYRRIRATWFPTRCVSLSDASLRQAVEASWIVADAETVKSSSLGPDADTIEHDYTRRHAMVLSGINVRPDIGIATDMANRVIRETSSSDYRLNRLLELEEFRIRLGRRDASTCTAIECSRAWANYYHWLVDALPRVWTLHSDAARRACAANGRKLVLFVSAFESNGLVELLRAMLPEYVALECVPYGTTVRAGRYLHTPHLSADYCGYLPKAYVDFFQSRAWQLLGCDPGDQCENIVVSRANASKRQLVNQAEMTSALAPFGFRTYTLEHMTLAEQARLFARARVVVAPHGAGLTNLLFARRCNILELFPSNPYWHYRWLARAVGHDYACMSGGAESRHASFAVDVDEVLRRLRVLQWL